MISSLSESSGFAAGDDIDLSSLINASLVDNDGSETITIELSGLPDGAELSSGGIAISISGGSAEVSASQLSDLTLNLGDTFTGNLDLGVTATSTESSTGASSSVSDTLSLTVIENNYSAPTNLNFVGNSNLESTRAGGVEVIAAGSVVGSVSEVIDADNGDSHTFSLSDDAGGLFAIDSNSGEITLVANHDVSTGLVDSVDVQVTDSAGYSYTETIGINFGTNADDVQTGTAGTDIIYGFEGSDTISGGDGDDVIYGDAEGGTSDVAIGNASFENAKSGGWKQNLVIRWLDRCIWL